MPYRLDTHVLTVDANVIHKVDTANPANLYSMWTVFSRCADSVEQGRRLENLSWRLWQREQLVETEDKPAPVSTLNTASRTLPLVPECSSTNPPPLSGSVDTLVDDDLAEILRQDSSISPSRRDRHISSDDFEKMIVSIVKDRVPLSPSITQTSLPMARKEASRPLPTLERSGSTTTTDSQSPSKTSEQASELSQSPLQEAPRTTVVRGFSPSQASFTRDSPLKSHDIPEPTSTPAPKPVQSKNKSSMWTLGGSCSSSELGHSVETRTVAAPVSKKPVFQIGGSAEEGGSLKSAMHSARSPLRQEKQASFANVVTTRTIASGAAVDSDSEPEYVDESAIDDDSSDWEDSLEDSGKSSMDDEFFQRIECKANLTSRPSLITLMLAQSKRAKNLGNHASQSTSAIPRARMAPSLAASPNDSDEAPLMMKRMRQSTLKPIIEAPRAPIPRSAARPIALTSNHTYAQVAVSPRTTRRNMLATEFTESLRRHLLWERQQKSSTANAVLKRRHTSHDVANLKQYPERHCLKPSEDVNASSRNQYFSMEHAFNGYHSRGW
ncbi:hypothetical protein B0I35DRAFT_455129 [Stachybotrys elegans]|uniref:Nitrogen regulatory protein areA GATA-like domain-containing protein n=1 Tax=Stachybotrys elegans TaxID=80388 RepID=A0A8K0WJM2_9HYPO|nr:hypothetical protein B0I35DRAFT_455129 [Stachybotrys elegans]